MLYRVNLLPLDFSPNDPIGELLDCDIIEYKYPVLFHLLHTIATANYPTSPRRNSLPPPSHQYSGNNQRFSLNNPKKFKDFFACRIVLVANHQYPGKYSKTFRPAKAINSSNQQQRSTAATSNSNHQQQPAAATSRSDQQQQPASATSSSNQQQRSTAAINSSNPHQQSAFIIPAAPAQSTPTFVSYHYGS